ncbi:C-type lectin [Amphibalanus amphitrite]|uniref:C-type lectin n=1 Tax=Amphibalanus amphitrite TaxID=1232801 RepID=A0A6A4X4W1_AMPAM|nr:C-type lectin [Amphibalanus amphitrite]
MRRPLLVLLCAAAAAGAGQPSFQLLSGVLAATPFKTLTTISNVACSSRCSRLAYSKCAAYSFAANGTCWLFRTTCLRTEPSADHPGVVSYAKPPEPSRWCPDNQGIAFDNRCFMRRHALIPLTWQAAQQACKIRDACSHLAMPTHRAAFLALWHFKRPNAYEWIGAEDPDGDGVMSNMDGSSSWTPPMYSWASAGPILMPDRYLSEIHRTTNVNSNIHYYICEGDLQCRMNAPCPAGWFLLEQYCYQYFADSRTWHDANAFCSTHGTNGQLASPGSNSIWLVLWDRLLDNTETRVFMGAHDIGREGLWYTLDGGGVGVPWLSSQPDNAGGAEHCLEMIGGAANDIPCDHLRHFICRSDAQLC